MAAMDEINFRDVYEHSPVSLWIEDKETKSLKELKRIKDHRYTGAAKQEIEFEAEAPDAEGEVKIGSY